MELSPRQWRDYRLSKALKEREKREFELMAQRKGEAWDLTRKAAQSLRKEFDAKEVFDVHPNESTFIPISVKHRLENPGLIPLQIIEVQNGDYVEEDDIERFDDEYQRIKKE